MSAKMAPGESSCRQTSVQLALAAGDGAPSTFAIAKAQLFDVERLADVRVGAEPERNDALQLGVPGAEDDDRNVRPPADLDAEADPIDTGKDHVEEHEVEAIRPDDRERLAAVGRARDLVTVVVEDLRDGRPHIGIVVDDEDVQRVSTVATRRRMKTPPASEPRPTSAKSTRPLSGAGSRCAAGGTGAATRPFSCALTPIVAKSSPHAVMAAHASERVLAIRPPAEALRCSRALRSSEVQVACKPFRPGVTSV